MTENERDDLEAARGIVFAVLGTVAALLGMWAVLAVWVALVGLLGEWLW